MQFTDDQIPLKRPHFHLRDGKLFFLISRRPHAEMDATDVELWDKINGSTVIGRLREQIPDAGDRIRRLWELGTVEVAPSHFAADRRRILVVEPHMDDAVLSVGGIMWQRRHECEFTVLSVVGVSNFTSYSKLGRDFYDVETVTRLRRAESETVMRLLGGRHVVLDHLDAPLRYQPGNWSLLWHRENRRSISAFINHAATDIEIESLERSLLSVFRCTEAQEIWIPLGVGTSADHEMTRNACLRALLRLPDVTQRVEIFLYQDVPYATKFPRHTDQIIRELLGAGASVERLCDDIGQVMPEKLRLLAVFGSQFKPSYMDCKVIANAHQAMASRTRCGEIRFHVRKLPERVNTFGLYSGRDSVRSLESRLARWYPRRRNAKRIRILCPMGVGCWKANMSCLLEAFPHATFEIHLIADAMDETKRFESARIELRPVPGTALAWIRRLLRVIVSRPHPLIVVSSAKLSKVGRIARAVYFFADPLVANTVDHLVQALRQRFPQRPAADPQGPELQPEYAAQS